MDETRDVSHKEQAAWIAIRRCEGGGRTPNKKNLDYHPIMK